MVFDFKGERLFPHTNIIELASKLQYMASILRRYLDADKIRWYQDGGLHYEEAVLLNEIYRNPVSKKISKEDLERTQKMLARDHDGWLVVGSSKKELRLFLDEGGRIWKQATGYTLHNLMPFFEQHEHKLATLDVNTLLHPPKRYNDLDCDELDREMLELILRGIGYAQAGQQPTHREMIICNQYKHQVDIEERKTAEQWFSERGSAAKKFFYDLQKKEPSIKELKTVIILLQEWPEAQKVAINNLALIQK
jgi:hypothetical protein